MNKLPAHLIAETVSKNFWKRVVIESGVECWGWRGWIMKNGYSSLSLPRTETGKNRSEYAHRISWRIHFGEIPKGMFVLHRCDNPRCSNPDHLFLGSQKENILDMWAKGRESKPPLCLGSKNPASKLTEENVLEIRASKGVVTNRRAAELFGVSETVIEKIRARKLWRHVE